MLAIVGTVPDPDFPLLYGPARLAGNRIRLQNHTIPVNRGTPALIAAALKASEQFGGDDLLAILVGDVGQGDGSRRLYDFLVQHLSEFDFDVLTFHYLQPDVDWHNRVLFAVDGMAHRPLLIADAGFMYAAKMSGQAERYDFFTPDVGELAFLADELAPHPFYTRGFILHRNDRVPELIAQAYRHRNAAVHLLVKGAVDHSVCRGRVIATVDEPACDAMEAIGGTGDTLTGLLTALCAAGFETTDAALMAAKANRWSGFYADSHPATQVTELIDKIPQALSKVLPRDQQKQMHGR